MNMQHPHSTLPATPEDIIAFEQHFGYPLPESYKAFLTCFNGGTPSAALFDYKDDYGMNCSRVRCFLSVCIAPDSLYRYLEIYADRLPSNALPVAYDDGGNLVCMVLETTQTPIVFWEHEQEDQEASQTTFYFIAESFEAFCDSLHAEVSE